MKMPLQQIFCIMLQCCIPFFKSSIMLQGKDFPTLSRYMKMLVGQFLVCEKCCFFLHLICLDVNQLSEQLDHENKKIKYTTDKCVMTTGIL